MKTNFQLDYRNILSVLHNERPKRLPLYEHHIDMPFISKYLGEDISLKSNNPTDLKEYYRKTIHFWRDMTYDAFDYEAAICDIYPATAQ